MKRFKLISILCLTFLLLQSAGMANAQAVAIKKWKGRYPRMNNNYPQSFIAFRGWLPPKPHLFIKTPLTHYYWKVKSMPVTDSGEVLGKTKTGLLRIFSKLMERTQFKGRYEETEMISLMTESQKQIGRKLSDSRKDQLADIYGLTASFLELYQRLDDFKQVDQGKEVKKILQKETDELVQQFLMVNLLATDHGEKFKAFSKIERSLILLSGEVDYSHNKMNFFNSYGKYHNNHYAFLTQ
ncbi:hypothetical protein [Labilibaculum manganireducens]|nr:hypothetical protein [Labilibaculum manganireducens]